MDLDFFRDLKTRSPVFAKVNMFVDSVVYDEIIDNLLYTELQLIQEKLVYEGIKAEKFNYFSLNYSEFDAFVSSITESNVKDYREAYDFLNKHYLERFDIYNMSRPGIDIFFKLYQKYYIEDLNSFKSSKVGIEFSANFIKRDFTLSNFKMMSEIVFSDNDNGKLPKTYFTLYDFKAISKIIFSDNDNSISNYKKFNLTGHMPKNS